MTFRPISPIAAIQPIATTSTTQNHQIGMLTQANDPTYGNGEFIYLKGVASTAAGDLVEYDMYTPATVRWAGTAGTGKPLAVAMSANVAGQYGWYQIGGVAAIGVSGTVAAGDKAFWQATATVSSTQVNGKQVLGCIAVSANAVPAAGQALYQLDRPSSQGQVV